MSHRLWQAWRGTLAQVLGVTPADGEPIWDNVTKRLRIGDGSTAGGLRVVMKADKDAADYGLSFEGVVTTATDTTHFKVSTLAGFGAEFFKPTAGAAYEIYVVQADNAAPEGEQKPVLVYTTSDGTFEHAEFTTQLAVGDIVLIIHPLLASLGTKATAAASGAVSTAKYMAAYIKQLVTLLRAVTAAGPTKDEMDTGHGLLATPAEVATALNTYDAVKRSEATTDKEAIITEVDANETLIGAKDDTVSAGVLADTESMFALLRRLATSGSLVHFGDVTAVDAGVSSTIADLIGWEDDYFLGWWMMIVRDDGGAGAAPQGEYRQITSYTSTTGLMNHTAFGTADVVGDQAMLIHPLLYRMFAATGGSGPRSLETLGEEQDADLDVARGTSGVVTVDGGEDNLYDESSDNEFVLLRLVVDLHNMVEGDSVVFKIYTTEDGVERKVSRDEEMTYIDVQDPARATIVNSANEVWGREGVRVCVVKLGGANFDTIAYYRDAKRGS